MNVLVLNCGSSSVKFQVIETDLDLIQRNSDRRLARGQVERVGSQALVTTQVEGKAPVKSSIALRDHKAALEHILQWVIAPDSKIESINSVADIHAVGHRVVHGGEKFQRSVKIDAEVTAGIADCIELAPLHNPANLKGIAAVREVLGDGVPQVAVFDTAFHSTMPEVSYLYGIPYSLYRRYKIRRYGFHGTSHRYISYRYRELRKIEREQVRIISLHLGNGCSACAVVDGASFVTSMGFTPMEGLLMGTRSGDIDPCILEFLSHKEGMGLPDIDNLLNKQSGLLGLSGLTGDMRELLEEEAENGDRRARLAIDVFCRRIKHYIGGYLADMGGADAVVFTGGIGENSPAVRARALSGLEFLGIELDGAVNDALSGGKTGPISTPNSKLGVYVIPTDEELLIARDTVRCVHDSPRRY
jgi:acetate kinase